VAYSTSGQPVRFLGLVEPQWRWLLCEATAADGLAVAFPSVKERLGRTNALPRVGGGYADPFSMVVRALREARRHVERATSAGIATAAICVPAMYPEAQRSALKQAASEAGWPQMHVINDAAAATMAHTGGGGNGLFLVYSLGYGSCENGLFRVEDGRYHALGHHEVTVPTGRLLDAEILAACLSESQNGTGADADAAREEADWLGLRRTAQQVKERLAGTEEEVAFPGRSVVFTRAAFDQRIRARAAETRKSIDTILDAADEHDCAAIIVGSRGLASEILSGKRGLSKRTISRLSQRFGVEPSVFLPVED
jgi:molecular chaperone DnaK (HSP70)